MIELRKTPEFDRWINGLRDLRARLKIHTRIRQLMAGNLGDHKSIGEGVWELRIHYGPGYRVYYTKKGDEWILLLAGGDKDSQAIDIRNALKLARKS